MREADRCAQGMALADASFMSIANTSALPVEPHDAPRVTPPQPEVTEPEVTNEPESLDVALDNPYDNIACTD